MNFRRSTTNSVLANRPRRWDVPFDSSMSNELVDTLLQRPEFSRIDSSRFSANAPLRGILLNDCRCVVFKPGEVIIREGDYGNSAFIVLSGDCRVVLPPGLPRSVMGRSGARRVDWLELLTRPFLKFGVPEMWAERRSSKLFGSSTLSSGRRVSLLHLAEGRELFGGASAERLEGGRLPQISPPHKTSLLSVGAIFGEVAAIGRAQRTATVYAETEVQVLEMRWQALRDIMSRDEHWQGMVEASYRKSLLYSQLIKCELFEGLPESAISDIASAVHFESFGTFDWHVAFNRVGAASGSDNTAAEARVVSSGDYADGLLLITSGFARVSAPYGAGERTVKFLREGDYFGLEELLDAYKTGSAVSYQSSLSALGYLHVLRIPSNVLADFVLAGASRKSLAGLGAARRSIPEDSFLEWVGDTRLINGDKVMLIDMDACVRCDDCVKACSDTHQGNPRFVREGEQFESLMIARSCMHCVDPVCMIGCPTGAIHRDLSGGAVVINNDTCVGCGTCAAACPYNNIRLVSVNGRDGKPVLDVANKEPILKATKCDYCREVPAGPACERACTQGALKRVNLQSLVLEKSLH